MSRVERRSDNPKAVIHRRILDVADDMPDASLKEIADKVSGASPELVDKVLAEYGDPTEEPSEPDDGGDAGADATKSVDTGGGDADPPTETGDADRTQPDPPELSERQREALGLIARNPDATQRELAAELDVTAATISRWVNDIPGFNWSDREAFATRVPNDHLEDMVESDGDPDDVAASDGGSNNTAESDDELNDSHGSDASDPDDTPAPESNSSDAATDIADMHGNTENGRTGGSTGSGVGGSDEIDDLRQRVAVLEDQLEEEPDDVSTGAVGSDRGDVGSDRIDTELLHKVVNACISSERITDKEEIRLLDHLLD